MQKEINLDLKFLYKWLLANKISLNCSKTELIFFHKPGNPIRNFTFKININGHKLTPTDHIKYLGVYLDNNLSGVNHYQILAKKLRRANGTGVGTIKCTRTIKCTFGFFQYFEEMIGP